jgi:APA family basic amino acid/polyamine antiporter
MKSAAIAALAYIFAQSFDSLVHLPVLHAQYNLFGIKFLDNFSIKSLASLLIIFLSFVNYRGLTLAEGISSWLTYTMCAAVLIFLVLGFGSGMGSWENLSQKSVYFDESKLEGWGILKAMTIASLGAFWGYEGWNHIGYLGEEVKNPKRNLPIALAAGTIIVMLIYISLNVLFAYTLPIDFFISLDSNKIAAIEVASKIWGTGGVLFIACLILVTTLNSTNSSIMMSSRILYAMARNGLFFKKAASVHSVHKTPDFAIFVQAIWSILLIWSGSFDQLTDMLVFASFIFYGATALGVIILRIKHPEIERKYKVWGYPLVPAFFVLFCNLLLVITIFSQPYAALLGIGLIASGIPFYLFWKPRYVQ